MYTGVIREIAVKLAPGQQALAKKVHCLTDQMVRMSFIAH